MLLCPVQEICQHFGDGTNKPPNHHIRVTIPCTHWLALDCEVRVELATILWKCCKEEIACNIADVKAKKEKIRGDSRSD